MTNAERQKAYRQRNARNVTAPVTRNAVTRTVTVCANCSVLAEEVAHLKRLLATANAGVVVQAGPVFTTAIGTQCVHGGLYGACRKLGCATP